LALARDKVKTRKELPEILAELRNSGRKIVFTNGCFDLLHPGHVRYLEAAKQLGDILLVAINSDTSVSKIKGIGRPVQPEAARCEVVAGLRCVDLVTTFSEDTPQQVINEVVPEVLVKGGDWPKDQIVGRETVESHGGQVRVIEFEKGFSTTDIISRICRSVGSREPSR
jgi:D-beta-D-heptose 7-phosphate kinase/D-beta-D-heptose 1-phosphate adenosyltransferase